MKRILFIGNSSSSVINFRKWLFLDLVKKGYEIAVICSDSNRKDEIQELGVRFFEAKFRNRSTNPFSLIKTYHTFLKIIKSFSPDLVFNYQLKANLFGSRAAIHENIPFVCLNEGLGDGFGNDSSLKGRIVKKFSLALHKKSFRRAKRVFVENHEDKTFFVDNKICPSDKITVINGPGIMCKAYDFQPIKADSFTVINISRLVRTKGIMDFCEIAKNVRMKEKSIEFILVGPEDELTYKDIEKYISDGDIRYVGFQKDVRSFLSNSNVLLLPSDREGFGLVLAEANLIGRPVIAYDVPGPRSLIIDGYNGFLVPHKDLSTASERILFLYNNPTEADRMGKNGRAMVIKECDVEIVNNILINCINDILK